MVTVEVLSSVFGCGVSEVASAVLVKASTWAGSSNAEMVTETSAPTGTVAPMQSTRCPTTEQDQPESLTAAWMSPRKAGSVSRTCTLGPTEGPSLCTAIV